MKDAGIIAIYPGSFDPVTLGHLDIIDRVSGLAGRLIVAVLDNQSKSQLFAADERVEMLRALRPDIEIMSFSGLLVDFARECGARVIIRGLRAVTDFEYEFQMALTNRSLNGELETLLVPSSLKYLYLSSSVAKEVFALGGDVDNMLPPLVTARLRDKFNQK